MHKENEAFFLPINEVAKRLSHLCKFSGATHRFYSHAEHCVLLSRVQPNIERGWDALFSDIHIVCGPITPSLDAAPIESAWSEFNCHPERVRKSKRIQERMEILALIGVEEYKRRCLWDEEEYLPKTFVVQLWTSEQAMSEFLRTYWSLKR